MRICGIDFQGSDLIYVVADIGNNDMTIVSNGKLPLGSERDPDDLKSFHRTVETVLHDSTPDRIAIKQKPHKGAMAAGPAAIKMEAVVLLCSTCPVVFVTPQRLGKVQIPGGLVFAYQTDALRVIVSQTPDAKA